MDNIFQLPFPLPPTEVFEILVQTKQVHIERIISSGQATPPDHWYDQEQDEWVILLQGQAILSYEDGREVLLKAGDYLLIAAHEKHRVVETSADPPCIWLAIHGSLIEN
ncbi:MAG: cupin domain-containing protein [Snowella sp.]